MPESKGRKAAEEKATVRRKSDAAQARRQNKAKVASLESPPWLAPTFIAIGLLGVAWLVVYYIASPFIPFMAALGGWNILIGMGLMAMSFVVATQWK